MNTLKAASLLQHVMFAALTVVDLRTQRQTGDTVCISELQSVASADGRVLIFSYRMIRILHHSCSKRLSSNEIRRGGGLVFEIDSGTVE